MQHRTCLFLTSLVSATFMAGAAMTSMPWVATPRPQPEPQAQPLMVVGAGLGRVGTTSFRSALDRLGLKCYHARTLFTESDLDVWAEHARLRIADKPGVPYKILDSMARQGYNATSGLPSAFLLREMMKQYPSLRVVLNIRGRGDDAAKRWANSIHSVIGPIHAIVTRFPFSWIPRFQKLTLIHELYPVEGGLTKWLKTGVPDMDELIEGYHRWERIIQEEVPAEKLLVHAPEDGWKPLCDFLSPVNADIEANCRDILANDEPYPRVNEARFFQFVFRCLSGCEYLVKFLLLVVVVRFTLGSWFSFKVSKSKQL